MNDRIRAQPQAPTRLIQRLRSAIKTWLEKAWSWLVPAGLPAEQYRQANSVLAVCLTVSIWVPVFAAIYLGLGARNSALSA